MPTDSLFDRLLDDDDRRAARTAGAATACCRNHQLNPAVKNLYGEVKGGFTDRIVKHSLLLLPQDLCLRLYLSTTDTRIEQGAQRLHSTP